MKKRNYIIITMGLIGLLLSSCTSKSEAEAEAKDKDKESTPAKSKTVPVKSGPC